MDAFLRANKDRLESVRGEASLNIHVVLSNEACDLDSAVSSLVWAYYLDKQQAVTRPAWDMVLPVLNIPHVDYSLRTEVTHFLSLVNGIGASALAFRDDLDLASQHAAGHLALTLVDHNTLAKPDAALDPAVVEVIDHHANDRQDDPGRDIRVAVEMVGSCSTLVAERILAESPDVLDENIAKLLLGPILVDTVNLSPSAGKATAKDIAMVETLAKICPDLNLEEMYQELQQAKADMSDFSVTDILRKDFKCICGAAVNIGMSSIPMDLKEFVDKPDVDEELRAFCTAKNLRLEVLMALTVDDNDVAHRQISVYSPTSTDLLRDDLMHSLETSSSPELLLSKLDIDASALVIYDQGNVKASRKQVMPLVRDFLNRQEEMMEEEEEETEEPLATEAVLTDMNDTLLKLSSNTNNANILSSDPFGIGDNQVVSSPDSSGIDAGSVLLDLDPFSLNQNGMVMSGSGTFSSRDSVDTLGITPSSPGSDAVGFGSGTEDLLGLDPLGSSQQTLDPGDPFKTPSNPFASSVSSDTTLLDAFMSPLDPVQDKPKDPEDAPTPEPEATVSVLLDNPSLEAEDSGSSDLLGLDPFSPAQTSEHTPSTTVLATDPFSVSDTAVTATVSTNVESSPDDLGDFMNQLPVDEDGAGQESVDPASSIVDLMSDGAVDPLATPSHTTSNPFQSEGFGSQSRDSTDQPSDLISGFVHEDEPQASVVASLQEQPPSEQIHDLESEPQDVLNPTPEATIAQKSDYGEEFGDEEPSERNESPPGETEDEPSHSSEESFGDDTPSPPHETDSTRDDEGFSEQDASDVSQNEDEATPSPDLGADDGKTEEDVEDPAKTATADATEDSSADLTNTQALNGTVQDSPAEDSVSHEMAQQPEVDVGEASEETEDQLPVDEQEENFDDDVAEAVPGEYEGTPPEGDAEEEEVIPRDPEQMTQAENSEASGEVLEMQRSSDDQEALEDVVSDADDLDDADVEVSLTETDDKVDIGFSISGGLESVLVSGAGSVPLPTSFTLEVPVAGAPDSLGANFSSMAEEAAARSSGITSPDSDFTSDIISDDPSSGDSYIVTDLSHEVGNHQIDDIQEEIEEEEALEEQPRGASEIHIEVSEPEGDQVGTSQEPVIENLDSTASVDNTVDAQTEVIDDYFPAESPTDQVEMDVIPIPTDVGFESSGRSTPKELSENEDDALLKDEARDIVEGVIKMATITFLEGEESKDVSDQKDFEEGSADHKEEIIGDSEEEDAVKDAESVPLAVASQVSPCHEAEDSLRADAEELSASELAEVQKPETTMEELISDMLETTPAQEVAPEDESQPESLKDVQANPPSMIVEEEVAAVVISQEESAVKSDEGPPQGDESIPDEVVQDAEKPIVEDIVVTSELQTEQEVPLSGGAEASSEAPIEVNVLISEHGPEEGAKSEPSASGKTKLSVEDSAMDVDIEEETNTRKTSVFGLADVLEYVNADGEVEASSTDLHPRPSTLSLASRSTPKSARLLSAGTPISMLSDTGTPMTPLSLRSLDITSDTGTDEDILDRTREEEQSPLEVSPPVTKRCISIDSSMVEDIHGEWDDKKRILDDIVEKERKKSVGEKAARPSPKREMSFGTAEAKERMEGVVLPDEWQDDEFSQQKLAGVDSVQDEDSFFRRRVPPKDSKEHNRDSILSDDGSVEGLNAWAERLAGDDCFDEEDEIEAAALPDDTLNSPGVEPIPEYTAKEEMEDRKNWRKVVIGGKEHTLDMRAINPYKKVLSHGGYYGDGVNAIIVLASCYMPDRSRKDYNYIMNNLFLYVISTLELLVVQDYVIVYFHGAAPKNRIPSLTWMRKCYQMIDRKLRKNLKGLYIVHPTTWLRTIIRFTRPFISSKFSRKLKFVDCLDDLPSLVNMEYIYIPDEVRRVDKQQKGKRRK